MAPILGLKRLVLPVSYWRMAEFTYTWNQLHLAPGSRILDVGSPKELAMMLARNHAVSVVATDILPPDVRQSKQYTNAQGLSGLGAGKVHSEVQDGRELAYADDTFDEAFSVSVLEHIPEDGDGAAIRELVRVVKPGGRIIVTVPYSDVYGEDWVNRSVYERAQGREELVFYQRHYDEAALRDRLLGPASAKVLDVEYWGEGAIGVERILDRSASIRRVLSPLEPVFSLLFLKAANRNGDVRRMAAFLTLRVRPN